MLTFCLLLAFAFARSSMWSSMDYKGLNVRDWENGLLEAKRREMPIMVIYLQSNVIDDAIRKVLDFNQDESYMKRTSKFVVVVADDSDPIFTETFGESEEVKTKGFPKVVFYHYNGMKFNFKNESPNYQYDDSFDLTDAMEDVLDIFEEGIIPQKKEL
ncbi:hypothetical protein EDI_339360 [Entamoeba dispar SAW760]|uniref:Thioredoxin domain-containing protein n=1 Tax=Entamoeba dispar (strain ATCC PRA-260 / SAW760) TaxID=370354 RepID=B0EDV3_ENTDS|nr:uncharacterized protein EDI_339360 [Entamoeba dispar SAW760]EDR27292.1 hypothetical protein EDI_339360 [Entamoeba dispar SAW760]|eukprot:EDR27292.1 hypothetical protein EDI_339360 [Entamoeba dispar SAW760]